MSEQLPEVNGYARALELYRRHLATSAFLGVDPSHRSCDGPPLPILAVPPVDREEHDPSAQSGYTIHIDRATGDMTVTQYEQGGHDD